MSKVCFFSTVFVAALICSYACYCHQVLISAIVWNKGQEHVLCHLCHLCTCVFMRVLTHVCYKQTGDLFLKTSLHSVTNDWPVTFPPNLTISNILFYHSQNHQFLDKCTWQCDNEFGHLVYKVSEKRVHMPILACVDCHSRGKPNIILKSATSGHLQL